MKLVKLKNGQPEAYSYARLMSERKDISWPRTPTMALLAEYDVFPLKEVQKPDFKKFDEELDLEYKPDPENAGFYREVWTLRPLSDDDRKELVREAVDAERDRRIAAGATFSILNVGDMRIAGDKQTIENLKGRATNALIARGAGITTPIFAWRDEDNTNFVLTPDQMLDLFNQASMFVDAIYRKSWPLKDNAKDGGPFPSNYTDDVFWG